MTREEAIHIVKTTKDWSELREALTVLVPELEESQDETTRKELINYILYKVGPHIPKEQEHRWVDYLERQKEQKPNPLYGSTEEYYREAYYDQPEKEQKTVECANLTELADHIKEEFEGFRTLLKKNGIDYEPQRAYWESFARLFVSSAKTYAKPAEWNEEEKRALNHAIVALSMYANGEIPYILPSQLLEDVEGLKSLRQSLHPFLQVKSK